jgi:hypothetical protein
MSTSTRLSIALLSALVLLAGCGASGLGTESDYPRWGGPECVDSSGFPVPCDHWDAHPYKAAAADTAIGWAGSANAALVADADGSFVTFDAEAPHAMRVGAFAISDLRATPDGRVFWFDQPVGHIALATTDAGSRVAVLVSDDGTYLDLTIDADGLVLRRTALDATLDLEPTEATAEAAATSGAEPMLPAGLAAGAPLALEGLATLDVLVETL